MSSPNNNNTQMTLSTPLARLGTFLFPSNSRRISAPPPISPPSPQDSKRRPAITPCDSPPRCRRRLSFTEPESSPTAVNQHALLALLLKTLKQGEQGEQGEQEQTIHEQIKKWDEVARLARMLERRNDIMANQFVSASIEKALTTENGPVFGTVVDALAGVLEGSLRPLGRGDEPIVAAVLDGMLRNLHNHVPCVQNVLDVVLRNDWGRVFAGMPAWGMLWKPMWHIVSGDGVDERVFGAGLRLLAECGSGWGDIEPVVIGGVVANLERVCGGADIMGQFVDILSALEKLVGEVQVARLFVKEGVAAVLKEISGVWAGRLEIQHACVDVLVRLAMPDVLGESMKE